jgi:hypothetical protein
MGSPRLADVDASIAFDRVDGIVMGRGDDLTGHARAPADARSQARFWDEFWDAPSIR